MTAIGRRLNSHRRRKAKRRAVEQVVEAAQNVRFYLHCELLPDHEADCRAAHDAGNEALALELYQQSMGQELAAEAMRELQEALTAYYGGAPPSICSGCSPLCWEVAA